jgi:hypothetical protein
MVSRDSGQIRNDSWYKLAQALKLEVRNILGPRQIDKSTLFEAGFFVAADLDAGLALEVSFLDTGLALDAGTAFAFGLPGASFLASPVTT